METFTKHYLAGTTPEMSDLPLWENYMGAAALVPMAYLGLAPEVGAVKWVARRVFELHR